MSRPVHTIAIDRIVLADLGVTPDRAERIRALVADELQSLLEQEGWADGLAAGEIPHLAVPVMALAEPNSDHHLAGGVARSIAQALRGVGSSK